MSDTFGSRLPLSRAAVDRDHRSRELPLEQLLADPATRAVVLHNGQALLATAERLELVEPARVPAPALTLYLGRAAIDADDLPAGSPVVAMVVDDQTALDLGGAEAPIEWGDLRRIGARLSERDAGLFTQALALANWHAAAAFSPRSGVVTAPGRGGWVRVEDGGHEHFPRTDAAVIMSVVDDEDRILLGRNANWPGDRYSVLAGFVEPGESLEAAVIREVWEEAGLRVVEPRYLGSQPWPFPASLMLAFTARLAPGASSEPDPDGDEIMELRWFTRDELAASMGEVVIPPPTSIARHIIEDWFGGELDDGARRA